ncbi:MAG: hypothetical protein M0Z28_10235 [Rhodospirillales bacterium]|nr:hypothetical protein [Rhodospirillales bacterium]
MPISNFIPAAEAVIRLLEAAALACVSTDPAGALRLALLAAELRAPRPAAPARGRA